MSSTWCAADRVSLKSHHQLMARMTHLSMWEVHMNTLSIVVVGLAMAIAAPPTAGQESVSSARAAALTKQLDQHKLDAVAAPDPDQPDRFVAALYYPGAQLLAISAAYPVPQVLRQRIADRKYRDAYLDLQGPATLQGRFFVMDLQADGLRHTRNGDAAFDITYESGGNQASFDGDWKRQNMSRSQYDARFTADDERYARMLAALERELTRASTSVTGLAKSGR